MALGKVGNLKGHGGPEAADKTVRFRTLGPWGVYPMVSSVASIHKSRCIMAAAPDSSSLCNGPRCVVLLIEDDLDDVFLFERAFAQSKIPCTIHSVQSVEHGIDYLKGNGPYSDRGRFPLPNLMVTDLAFRGDSGLQFMNWLHYQSEFRTIPIVCITGSSDPGKLEQAKSFGVRCIQKSALFEEVVDLIRDLLPPPSGSTKESPTRR